MSPWVRLDEHAMEHPKVAGLPDGAFRLWIVGLSYCQNFLTDGFITDAAMRGLRAYSPNRRRELIVAGLWEEVEGGTQVHDYLQWNESRAHVLNSREQAKERLRKHKEKRVPNAIANAHPTVRVLRGSSQTVQAFQKNQSAPPAPESPSADLAERAGRFVERYQALYQEHRKGARYIGKPNLDYLEAVELCRVWDDARLEKIAIVFLTTDHDFAEKGSRTIAQFRSMASWCDSRLAEAGIA